MHLHRALTRLVLIPAACGLLGAGCAAKTSSTVGQKAQDATEQPSPTAQTAGDATGRVRDLISKVGALQENANKLPGSNDAEFRPLMERSFGDLLAVFPLLEGDYQSGEFRQGVRILDTSRQQLANGSSNLAIEPTVGQGLRATVRLLADVNNVVLNNNEEFTKKLDGLRQRVDQLDAVHGPMNRVVASQAMRDAAGLLQQISTILAEQTGVETPKPAAAKPDAATLIRTPHAES